MSGTAEILCSRCGTPFPKEKGKTAVTCVVCGQLRPDLDLTLDDDDDDAEDLGAALSSSSGGGGPPPVPTEEPENHVLRVATPAPMMSGGIDSAPEPPRRTQFRVDQPYMPMAERGLPSLPPGLIPGQPALSADRLLDRIGVVLLVVCPLAVGMAGGLNMLQKTDNFSTGTWYAVGVVFAAMLAATLVLGLVATGVLYLIRIRWTLLLRVVFIAAAAAVGYYGVQEVPSHIQVRYDGLPGVVLRR